jgi:hypothetical protein
MKLIDIFEITEIDKPALPDVLYHFTTPENFIKILNSDKLKAHPVSNRISFTEDPDLWAFQEFLDSNQEIAFRMAFKTDSLPPVEPFTFQGAPGEFLEHEQEWITTSGNITDIEDRIIRLSTLKLTALKHYKQYLLDNTPGHILKMINFI